jgi:hypothetical protein
MAKTPRPMTGRPTFCGRPPSAVQTRRLPLPFDHILFPITEFFPAKLQASTRSRFDLRA